MRRFLVFCLLAAFLSAVQAQAAERIDIIDFGIYAARVGATVSAPGTAFGQEDHLSDVKLIRSATTIPARVGVSFGFRYRVIGTGNNTAKLKIVVRVPSPGMRNPKTGDTTMMEAHSDEEKIGAVAYNGYTFDEDWELVPGTWTFEVWEGDRKLASQSFDVIRAT